MARAVLFDMGGTLWHFDQPPDEGEVFRRQAEQVQPLMREWGAGELDAAAFLRGLWEQIDQEYRNPELRDPDALALIERAFASQGLAVSRPRCQELWQRSYILARHLGWTLFPDTADTLRALRELDVSTAIVTNRPHTSALFRRDLQDCQLAQLVDAVVCSADVGYVKPHAAPFERALAMLGVAPGEAVMVGDSLESDISGAKALGLTTVWKTELSGDELMTYEADYTIGELGELLTLGLFL